MTTIFNKSIHAVSLPEDSAHISARVNEVTSLSVGTSESTYLDVAQEALSDLAVLTVKVAFGIFGASCTAQTDHSDDPVLTAVPSSDGTTYQIDAGSEVSPRRTPDGESDTLDDTPGESDGGPILSDADQDGMSDTTADVDTDTQLPTDDADTMSVADDGMTLAETDASVEPDVVLPPDTKLDDGIDGGTDAIADTMNDIEVNSGTDALTDGATDSDVPLTDVDDAVADVEPDLLVGPEATDDTSSPEVDAASEIDTASDVDSTDASVDASDGACIAKPTCTVDGPNTYSIKAGDPAVVTYKMSGDYYMCTAGKAIGLPVDPTPITVSDPSAQGGMSKFGCAVFSCDWSLSQDCPEVTLKINQPPVINVLKGPKGIGVLPGGDQCFSPANKLQFAWDASDANSDALDCTVNVIETVSGNKAATISVSQAAGAAMFADLPTQFLKPRTDYCWSLTCNDGNGGVAVNGADACFTTSEKGLIGWWRFDEGKGNVAKDSSGNGVDGTLTDFDDLTKAWVKTPTGGGLLFDGVKNYIQTNSPAAWNSLNALTAIATFSNAMPLNEHAVLIDKLGDLTNRWALEFYTDKTLLFGSCAKSVACALGNIPQSKYVFTDNLWHTVVGVYDGSQASLIVDGVMESQVLYATPGGALTTSSNFLIGRWNNGGRFYHGTIDEVRLYNLDPSTVCK